MQVSKEYKIDIGNDEFSIIEWPGTGDPILLLHATGFHSRCWNQVVKQLPGKHIYAADLRFHGDSSSAGEVDWKIMAEDIGQLIKQLNLKSLVGVGHSIGGHLIARVAATKPERFKHVVLIDPVIMSPDTYDGFEQLSGNTSPHDHPVSRRKNRWQDAEEMFQRFKDREPFSLWQQDVLRDYCDYALRPVSEQDYLELACDPINEASIYLHATANRDMLTVLPHINTPVTLLRAAPADDVTGDLSGSPTWPELASKLPNCREIYLPHMNHFIPMHDPEMVANCIRDVS
jgi:pimeloyl-ACP methyl ester carboxylesterase